MARSDRTAFFHTRNKQRLLAAIKYCCSCDDYHEIPTPRTISEQDAHRMYYGKSHESPIWAFAWLPTTTQWTVLKTAPPEWLCEYPGGYLRPRLAVISMLLGCCAIQVNMYQEASIHTIEGDSVGNCCIAGATLDEVQREVPEDLRAGADIESGGRIGLSSTTRAPFVLCQEHNWLFEKSNGNWLDDAAHFGETITNLPYDDWSDNVQFEYLLQGRPLLMKGAQVWYFSRSRQDV